MSSAAAVHKNGNSKFINAERRTTNGSSSTMPYLNGGDKIVTGKPPLKNRKVNGSLNKANSNDVNATTNKKQQTMTNGKGSTTSNVVTKTNSFKKKIFTKGRVFLND